MTQFAWTEEETRRDEENRSRLDKDSRFGSGGTTLFHLPEVPYSVERAVDRIARNYSVRLHHYVWPRRWNDLPAVAAHLGVKLETLFLAMRCLFGLRLTQGYLGIGLEPPKKTP
jgi:hypothetical protein